MKMLFVVSYPPYPPAQGGEKVIYHRLQALADTHDIYLVCPEPPPEQREKTHRALSTVCKEVHFYARSQRLRTGRLQSTLRLLYNSLFNPLPQAAIQALGENAVEMCEAIAARVHLDLINFEHAYTYAVLEPALKRPASPLSRLDCVACEQNVEHQVWEDAALNPLITGLKRWLLKREAKKMFEYTRRIYPNFRRIIYISAADAEIFKRLGWNANLSTASVMLPAPLVFKTPEMKNRPQLIFASGLGYFPNEEGLLWFYEKIWPLVRSRVPTARLVITGAPTPRINRAVAHDAAVTLTGFLDKPHFEKILLESDASISPIRLGSGIKMKNIEAMSYAMPMIATPESMRGITCTDGEDVLIAGTTQAFADATVRLLTDAALREKLSANARKNFLENYSCEMALHTWKTFYAQPQLQAATAART